MVERGGTTGRDSRVGIRRKSYATRRVKNALTARIIAISGVAPEKRAVSLEVIWASEMHLSIVTITRGM